jgi:hypothetical protein
MGDRGELIALATRQRRLLEEHPATTFCMGGVGATLRDTAMFLAIDGRRDEAAELLRLARPIAFERQRDAVFVLANAVLGRVADVDRGIARATQIAPVGTAMTLCVLERWNELPPLLAHLDGWATRGGAPFGALADAIREEEAAAKGGPPPRHERLHELGYHGWSELVAYHRART